MPGLTCWNCGADTGLEGRVTRLDHCPKCNADLRCCRGCRHYDPTRRFHCRETIDGPVQPKDKANFCDLYMVRLTGKAALNTLSAKDERKKKFDDLFGE